MASQAFITFVLNLTYLMETFSDLIFNHGHIQWLAYKMPESEGICFSQTLTGWLQHTTMSSLFLYSHNSLSWSLLLRS